MPFLFTLFWKAGISGSAAVLDESFLAEWRLADLPTIEVEAAAILGKSDKSEAALAG